MYAITRQRGRVIYGQCMTAIDGTNTSSGSTKWEWRLCRLRAAPAQGIASPAKLDRSEWTVRHNWRRPQGMTLQYKGGPEASVVVCKGKKCWRFGGHVAIYDVLRAMCNDTLGEL